MGHFSTMRMFQTLPPIAMDLIGISIYSYKISFLTLAASMLNNVSIEDTISSTFVFLPNGKHMYIAIVAIS